MTFALLLVLRRLPRPRTGLITLTFITLLPLGRLITEHFRDDPTRGWFFDRTLGPHLTNGQAASLALLGLAAVGWHRYFREGAP